MCNSYTFSIFYIRDSRATLDIFQLTYGYPWYVQISNSIHGKDPLPVGEFVNTKALLKYTGKIPT